MKSMDQDLNLLKVLVTIGETLNLTKASAELNISQPALSYSLKKLREDFKDPLFVRGSHGFQPTPRATELIPRAKDLIESTIRLYSQSEFSLKTYEKTLTIAATSYFEAIVIVKLMKLLETEAPRVNLKTISLQGEFPKRELESGEADIAIAGYFQEVPENYFLQKFGKDGQVIILRKNHPYLKTNQTLQDYLDCTHIKIDVPLHSTSQIDALLDARKLTRKIVGRFNNFLSPLISVAQTNALLTIPRKLAHSYQNISSLEIVDVPIKNAMIETKMVWHARNHADPFNQWIRKNLKEIYNQS